MARGALVPVNGYKIPRGRTAAEKRLSAIAALHQPMVKSGKFTSGEVHIDLGAKLICTECSDRYEERLWPCATAKLLGEWPGEIPEEA